MENITSTIVTKFTNDFSEEIWKTTYKAATDNNVDDTFWRVARAIASVESNEKLRTEWSQKFFNILSNFKITVGGRIYSNAGSSWSKVTLINCFAAGAQVLTSDGYINIEDVSEGDLVLTHTGKWQRVNSVLSRKYLGDVYVMRDTHLGGEIVSTPEHPFLNKSGEWTKADSVEHVVLPYFQKPNDENRYITIDIFSELKDFSDNIILGLENNIHVIKTKNVSVCGNGAVLTKVGKSVKRDIVIDENFAYVLGRFVGDGCSFAVPCRSLFEKHGFNIVFAKKEHRAMELCKKILEQATGLDININGDKNRNFVYLRKLSHVFSTFLSRVCGEDCTTKKIPEFIWMSCPSVRRAFLTGVIDSDGTVTKNGEIKIVMNNRSLIAGLQSMFMLDGSPSKMRVFTNAIAKYNHGGNYVLEINKKYSVPYFSSLLKVYDDDRLKRTELENNRSHSLFEIQNSIASVQIKKERKHYDGYVYNLSVENDNSYVVNNAIVHNCYVGPRDTHDVDSVDGILKILREQLQTLKSEGGWGMNFSFIRPRGAFIYGIGVETPGAVKYMEIFDKGSEIITAGSGLPSAGKKGKIKIRKGAMMGVLDIWHPDVEEFITAKQTSGRLTKFNLSVNCTDAFMSQVLEVEKLRAELAIEKPNSTRYAELVKQIEENDKWELIFPDTTAPQHKKEWDGNISEWKRKGYPVKVYKTTTVTHLWNLITTSTYNRNEPGVLFTDVANRTHAWNYGGTKAHIAASNPCGEQLLPFGGCCNLLSVNLPKFYDMNKRRFDFDALVDTVKIAVRLSDDVNEYSQAPLPEYVESLRNRRRIGIGILGWGSLLYLMKLRFGSDEAEAFKKKMMKKFTHAAVETSIELAEEKGMFKDCNPELHAKAFIWDMIDLPDDLRKRMRKSGIRNSALFSIQPTGNTSILANLVSGGCEPVFMHEYVRTSIVQIVPDHIRELCPKFWEGEFKETKMFRFALEGDEVILYGKDEGGTVYKIDKGRGLTKETVCEDYAVKALKEIGEWEPNAPWAATTKNLTINDHVKDLIGWYQWLDSSASKTINLPNDYSYEDFKKVYLTIYKSGLAKGVTTYREGTMASVLSAKGTVGSSDKITKTNAPKRPEGIPCQVHHTTVKGNAYYVVVGMIGNDPYEIFTGTNEEKKDLVISKDISNGIVFKRSRGNYELVSSDKMINGQPTKILLTNGHSDENADALTRMISTALRHGADISFVVHQLEKTEGSMVAFSKVLARTLKKYIPDGTKTGEKCPECEAELVRREGCVSCSKCTYSKCG